MSLWINQENDLIAFLKSNENIFLEKKLKILFESDYSPIKLAKFIDRLNPLIFGINYDIGNSASLGFKCEDEFNFYSARIINVHVKDRLLGGTTVPLGKGCANFEKVFQFLARINYQGNYILQTWLSGFSKTNNKSDWIYFFIASWIIKRNREGNWWDNKSDSLSIIFLLLELQ